ncbi:MAG: hypothetical protein JSV04_07365 [Candidatus Heimdallarchaeota archaeon]|nr:MAG: hypothetical protein JSV04_07365 [Candidatus Heimdallarchaeota archaeon]
MERENTNHQEIIISEEEMNQLADRALILLSFKDTDTQNLRFILNLLGIRTPQEKQAILKEIFRLIRKGIVYVPKGLPQLLDQRSQFNIDYLPELENLDICLLCPHDRLIRELQKEIAKIRSK